MYGSSISQGRYLLFNQADMMLAGQLVSFGEVGRDIERMTDGSLDGLGDVIGGQ